MTTVLAQRLTTARRMRGVAGIDVAERAGITAGNLSNMEAGRVLPGVDALLRLADALDVDVDWLLGRTAEPTSRSENACGLAARITRLSEADRRLTVRFLLMLATTSAKPIETARDRIRRGIETSRSNDKTEGEAR